ncbi:hypothetical protein WA026_000125 [Henosepilachna vigintioctopunctata]|uniref:G-protein coupled receptors family 1 profile domain-containing protein n=1 Tax=Henosepilachna vigintioctopunctata TaxID=420089 RepID=A0AAW1V6W7_9CUCU
MVISDDNYEEIYELDLLQAEDYSEVNFINEIWVVKPLKEIIVELSIFLPVIIIGLSGNFLLIFTLATNKHLRTPANLMIGNMALADMLSLLVHPWVYLITYDFFQNYILGPFICRTEAALECAILISSVMSLSVISYDRLSSIVVPNTGLNQMTARICMVCTWLTGFFLSTPLIIFRSYKERQWKDFLETFCVEQPLIIQIYWPTICAVLVWLPLTILIICYISIFIKLQRFESVVLRKALSHQRKASYKKKVAKMMFIVILTFMLCRLPFTVLIFWRFSRFTGKSPQNINNNPGFYFYLWLASKFMIFLNAALNPIIYGITNEKFRKAFKNSKLSNWLFVKKSIIPDCPKNEQKTDENIFFIFKWKIKQKEENTRSNKTNNKENKICK